MFCKWCGTAIPEYQTTCPRCRREQPPLADCGGFFHLAPQTQRSSSAVMPQERREAETIGECIQRPERNNGGVHRNMKKQSNLPAIIAICIAMAALLISMIYAVKLQRRLDRIEKNLWNIMAEQETEYLPTTQADTKAGNQTDAEPATDSEPTKEATATNDNRDTEKIVAKYDYSSLKAVVGESDGSNGFWARITNTSGEEHSGTIYYKNENRLEFSVRLEKDPRMNSAPVILVKCIPNNESDASLFKISEMTVMGYMKKGDDNKECLETVPEEPDSPNRFEKALKIPEDMLEDIDEYVFEITIEVKTQQGSSYEAQMNGIRFDNYE